jgi:hypothetical protein
MFVISFMEITIFCTHDEREFYCVGAFSCPEIISGSSLCYLTFSGEVFCIVG